MRRIASLLPSLPACLGAALSAQSTLTQHGETVFGSGLSMPSSQGASNDFPAGATMLKGALVTAALQPVMDAEGTMVFAVRAKNDPALGITNSNSQALIRGRGASDLRMLLRQGDTVPGLPATTQVSQITAHHTSPFGGHLLLGVRLEDPVVPTNTGLDADTALLIGQPGSWQVLMREGDPAPIAGPGAVYGEIDTQGMGVTSSGQALFRNNLQTGIGGVTTANNAIMVFGSPGSLTLVARNGSPWTGVGAAGEFVDRSSSVTSFVANNVRLVDSGHVLHDLKFVAGTGSATSTANDRVLAIWDGVTDHVLAREGDQAPGMPAGAVFVDSGLGPFSVMHYCPRSKAGTTVFSANFPAGPGGVTSANDRATFLHDGTTLSLLLREGDPAPASLGAGVTWGVVAIGLQNTDGGQLAFAASLGGTATSTNDSAVFVGPPHALAPIAREGDPVPGMPGFFFGDLASATLAATQLGDVLLFASVSNGVPRNVTLQHTAQHGWRLFFDTTDPFAAPAGTTTQPTIFAGAIGPTADNTIWLVNNQGDVGCVVAAATSEVNVFGCTYKRGHIGSLIAKPGVVPATGGVPQQFVLDCGPGNANRFYLLLATGVGTRPGFPSPLGPQLVPLNYDLTWTQLSLSFVNSNVWSGTFGFTDANGKGVGPASFTLPTGVPGLAGTSLHHAAVLFDTSLVSHYVTEPAGLLLR